MAQGPYRHRSRTRWEQSSIEWETTNAYWPSAIMYPHPRTFATGVSDQEDSEEPNEPQNP